LLLIFPLQRLHTPRTHNTHTHTQKAEKRGAQSAWMHYEEYPDSSLQQQQQSRRTFFPVRLHECACVCVNVADLATYCTIFLLLLIIHIITDTRNLKMHIFPLLFASYFI